MALAAFQRLRPRHGGLREGRARRDPRRDAGRHLGARRRRKSARVRIRSRGARALRRGALARGGSRNALAARRSAMDCAKALAERRFRDPRLRKLFTARSVMATLVNATSGSAVEGAEVDARAERPGARDKLVSVDGMTTPGSEPGKRRLAVILSGGGARGAYEVGVLWYIFEELTRILGAPPQIDVLCGTSVGAINACFLAAHFADPVLGLRRLVELWGGLELGRVLRFGVKQMLTLPRVRARRRNRTRSVRRSARWPSLSSARLAGAPSRGRCEGAGFVRSDGFMHGSGNRSNGRIHGRRSRCDDSNSGAASHRVSLGSDWPATCARERRTSNDVSAGSRRRRALSRRRAAAEHAHRAGPAPRSVAHIRHWKLARDQGTYGPGWQGGRPARPCGGVSPRESSQRLSSRSRRRRYRATDENKQRDRGWNRRIRSGIHRVAQRGGAEARSDGVPTRRLLARPAK